MKLFRQRDQLAEERLRKIDSMKQRLEDAKFSYSEPPARRLEEHAHVDGFAAAAASGAALELLRDVKGRMEALASKVADLERKFDERVPEKALSEQAFRQEVVDSGNLAQEIIAGVKDEIQAAANAHPIVAARDQMTIVEQKRIEKVLAILQEHGRLSSPQLATLMNLSRTRCNEYFRQMEEMGLVEGVEVGKEKFYKPCN